MSSVQELAAKSAAELRQRGWCQGVSADREGRVCAYGAISAAATGHPYGHIATLKTAVDLYDEVGDRIGRALTAWNDAPGRTVDDVLAVFDAIAAGE